MICCIHDQAAGKPDVAATPATCAASSEPGNITAVKWPLITDYWHLPLPAYTASAIIHTVIRSFADRGTEDVFDGRDSRAARRICPAALWAIARRKLDQLNHVQELRELAIPPGNRLERLRGDRAGQHSIRINNQYRVCFRWEDHYADEVEITNYH